MIAGRQSHYVPLLLMVSLLLSLIGIFGSIRHISVRNIGVPDPVPSYLHRESILPLNNQKEFQHPRKIVWLMSYPNSGTSYTNMNVMMMTQMATGSNYALNKPKANIIEGTTSGPWSRHPHLDLPESFVLVKTHCGGYCDECRWSAYAINFQRFRRDCVRTVTKTKHDKENVIAHYNSSVVAKAVHLIRNPFDNVVSRLRHKIDRSKDDVTLTRNATVTRSDYQHWCADVGNEGSFDLDNLLASGHAQNLTMIPCAEEWFRYVQWHNHALQVVQELNIPVHTLYYESYFSDEYNSTVHDLLHFLNATAVSSPRRFDATGKSYRIFTAREVSQAAHFVQQLATPACWALLKHYFAKSDERIGSFALD